MQHPHRIALPFYDAAVRLLADNGVPGSSAIPLIESVESFTLGSVLYATAARAEVDDVGESRCLYALPASTDCRGFLASSGVSGMRDVDGHPYLVELSERVIQRLTRHGPGG